MSSSSSIQQLLAHKGIWQASQTGYKKPVIASGYQALDSQLHYGGWPQASVSELLLSQHGIGEIRLLSPLLARLSRQPGYISWINPPYLPYAPALASQKLALDKLLLIKPKTLQESIWAAQQALSSGSCSAVLLWLPDKPLVNEIRKLSLAAKAGNSWSIIFRSQKMQAQPSPACLRIGMQVQKRRHQLSIIKQPGGWSGQQISLELFPERVFWNPLAAQHWPVYAPTPAGVKAVSQNNSYKLDSIIASRAIGLGTQKTLAALENQEQDSSPAIALH